MALKKRPPPTKLASGKRNVVPVETKMKAVDLLAEGWSDRVVAQQCGVRPMTIYTWRQRADFAAKLAARRRDVNQRGRQRLEEFSVRAIDSLIEIVDDTTTPPAVRMTGIAQVLDRIGMTGEAAREQDMQEHTLEVVLGVLEKARACLPMEGFAALHQAIMTLPEDVAQVDEVKLTVAVEARMKRYKQIAPKALSAEELEAMSVHWAQAANRKRLEAKEES